MTSEGSRRVMFKRWINGIIIILIAAIFVTMTLLDPSNIMLYSLICSIWVAMLLITLQNVMSMENEEEAEC